MAERLVVTANQTIRSSRGGACGGSGESLRGGQRKVTLGGERQKKSKTVSAYVKTLDFFLNRRTQRFCNLNEKATPMSIYILGCLLFLLCWSILGKCLAAQRRSSCVGHDVKCFLSNLPLLLQLQKGDQQRLAMTEKNRTVEVTVQKFPTL